jgi:hypothetical protein
MNERSSVAATLDSQTFDEETAEHISLGDDYAERADGARTVCDRAMVRDKLRGRETFMTFYRQGFLEVIERRGGRSSRCVPIDLRYLDPLPTIDRRFPRRLLQMTAGVTIVAIALAALAAFDVAAAWTVPAAAAAFATALMAGIGCFYLSHEEIRFVTLHGRAMTLRLCAGLGCIGRYRQLLPKIVRAIETAADGIGEDTMRHLRSEMREHYRLRGAGVLSDAECSDSTARILAQFDDPT